MEYKPRITVGDLVYYRGKTGNRIIGKVRKVNRVNSKVEVFSINDRIVYRPVPVTVYKAYLRRATENMQDFVYEYISESY